MNDLKNLSSREPVVLANLALASIPTLYGVLASFGVLHLTDGQLGAVTGAYVSIATLVIYLLRGTVWSPASVQRISDGVELVRTAETAEGAEAADAALTTLLPPPTI